jgi:hypothetical protein
LYAEHTNERGGGVSSYQLFLCTWLVMWMISVFFLNIFYYKYIKWYYFFTIIKNHFKKNKKIGVSFSASTNLHLVFITLPLNLLNFFKMWCAASLWVSRYSLCCFFAARLKGTVCSWGLLPFYALLAYNLNNNNNF